MRPMATLLGCALALCAAAPLQAQKARRRSPVLVPATTPAPAPAPAAAPADSARVKARRPPPTLVTRPGVTVDSSRTAARNNAAQQSVSTQAARPAASPAAA